MAIEWNVTLLAAFGVGLLVGLALGLVLRGRSNAADRERAEQLDAELTQTREDLEAHREEVARHFGQTSDLFRDMTEQYTRLYAHLAAGARAFSTGEVPALGQLDASLIGAPEEERSATDGSGAAASAAAEIPRPPPTNGGGPHAAQEG